MFYEIRRDDRLIGVNVTDHLRTGLSAVYTYFDPDEAKRSLGGFAILWLIQEARRLGLQWVYLGYYIPGCRKMQYKDQFRPLEAFIHGQWRKFLKNQSLSL